MSPERVVQLIFAQGQAQTLDPHRLGDHLSRAWREFQAKHVEANCMRVSTMNLMTLCPNPSEAEGLSEDLEEIVGRFPSRVLAAVIDPEARGELSGWLSCSCVEGNPHHLGCELVGLHVPQSGDCLPSLLIPQLRDGVPTFLWWRGVPEVEATWFEHLVETSTRVILDSHTFPGGPPGSSLLPIAALVFDRYHQEQAFSDLSWGRLRLWREMVTGLFDRPANLTRLAHVSRVEIEYWMDEDGSHPLPPMPLYMAGWLASRLGWKVDQPLQRGHDDLFTTRLGNLELVLRALPAHSPELASRLVGVRFSGTSPEGDFQVAVERSEAEPEKLNLSGIFSRAQLMQALQVKRMAVLALMAAEFETLGRDSTYEEALKAALALTGQVIPSRKVAA